MKFKKLFIIALISIFLIPSIAFALNFEVGEEILSSEIINDDYYAAGGTIQMESDVNGDLILLGGRIFVNSVVSQDLMLLGVDIIVRGEIKDDARIAGGNVTIDAIIKDDLILAGGNVELGENGFVGSDVTVAGGNITINGMINGDLQGTGRNIYINNVIKGNVGLIGVDNLIFGPNGKVMGNLMYRSPSPSKTVSKETVKGVVTYESAQLPASKKEMEVIFWNLFAGFSVFSLLTLLFAGLIFLALFRFYMINSAKTVYKKPLASLGIGFLILILPPILAVLFLITGIGWPFFFILIASWLIALYVAKLIAVLIISLKLVPVKDKSSFVRAYGAFALGALILILLMLIPIVGWIIEFILVVMGLGALTLYGTGLFKDLRKKKLV